MNFDAEAPSQTLSRRFWSAFVFHHWATGVDARLSPTGRNAPSVGAEALAPRWLGTDAPTIAIVNANAIVANANAKTAAN
jgi:hypothetical protein